MRRAFRILRPAVRWGSRVPAVGVAAVLLAVVCVTSVVVVAVHRGESTSRPAAHTAVGATTGPTSTVTVRRYDYLSAPAAESGADIPRAPADQPPPPDPRQNYGDLYLPAGAHARDSLPLVVLIHGGGWTARYGAATFDSLARALAVKGLAVFNIEYRRLGSGGGWPTTFTDVAAATDFVPTLDRENPVIDASSSTVVGHSAGAQLAVWVGTRGRLRTQQVGSEPLWQPNRIISLAGPLNMRLAAQTGDTRVTRILGGTPAQVPDRYRTVDPIENIDPTVPVLVVHGTADTVVSPRQSLTYVDAVRRAGGRVTLRLLPGQSHSALVTTGSPAFPTVVDLIARTARSTS
ncbi:alpha/beta hydrolase family protein [Williamsia serinedens]|uniref:Alpha/beta hydrolase family protein n=1 Tax=Williamsia serinedens TaxID=391736 RepID=A0ABT1H4R8_9NOCA|nr:alpha/beta hydrolase fold domain-containing protein [Williamsia serinedens]MCP2161568.1 Alpha/beta hydrolase family protein [Williamsia serinedens]